LSHLPLCTLIFEEVSVELRCHGHRCVSCSALLLIFHCVQFFFHSCHEEEYMGVGEKKISQRDLHLFSPNLFVELKVFGKCKHVQTCLMPTQSLVVYIVCLFVFTRPGGTHDRCFQPVTRFLPSLGQKPPRGPIKPRVTQMAYVF
jgi:hypothetical protein